jgi:hypothetical protein
MPDSGGFFVGIGELVAHVKTVIGLLIVLGFSIFGYGMVKGPFTWDNPLLTCGLMCLAASFAVKYLAKRRGSVYDGYRESTWFEWGNVLAGSSHLGIVAVLAHRLAAHRWLM